MSLLQRIERAQQGAGTQPAGPVAAPEGTVTTTSLPDTASGMTGWSPKNAWVTCARLLPRMRNSVPAAPLVADSQSINGAATELWSAPVGAEPDACGRAERIELFTEPLGDELWDRCSTIAAGPPAAPTCSTPRCVAR